jgi:hypothetical protein
MSTIANEITVLLTDLIQKKPTTKSDALMLLQLIELRLATYLISELPSAEQKIVLAVKGIVKESKSWSCWGK